MLAGILSAMRFGFFSSVFWSLFSRFVTGGRARCICASCSLTHCPVKYTVHRAKGDSLGVRPEEDLKVGK